VTRGRLPFVTLALATFAAFAGCGRSRATEEVATTTGVAEGDVTSDSATVGTVFHGVKYPLTSDNYRKWIVAQAALDSLEEPTDMPRIELRDPTDDDIDRTVDFLSNHDTERRAIERAGLSVRDFVLTSVALGQALHFASDELVPRDNRAFVEANRQQLVRAREARRYHVIDDDDDAGDRLGYGSGHQHKHPTHKHRGQKRKG